MVSILRGFPSKHMMMITNIQHAALLFVFPVLMSCGGQETSDEPAGLIPVAEFGESMAIGLSVNTENRVFVAFPNADGQGDLSLAVIDSAGGLVAYPDAGWNADGDYNAHFLRVQDLFVDAEDNLWVLDSKPGSAGNIFGDGGAVSGQFKLVKIDTQSDKVDKVYLFDDLDKSVSALNDVRVDVEKNLAYFSDPGQAAIVVLDLASGTTRTLLANSPYTTAADRVLSYDGVDMRNTNGNPFSSHINSIALTQDFKYFYFKPINQDTLFRVETRYLADTALSAARLSDVVENMGAVGATHGMIAGENGNIYLTTSESYSISYLSPDGQLHQLVHDRRLLWPDSFGIGSDGYLYVSCAQLQRLPQWNDGVDKTEYPYTAFKVKLPE